MKYIRPTLVPLIIVFALAACSKKGGQNPSPTPGPATVTISNAVDSNVYFVGTSTGTYPANYTVATYWKSGVKIILPDNTGPGDTEADAIALSGTDVFLVGQRHVGTAKIATYWKNATEVNLGSGRGDSQALAITFNVSDLYIAGFDENSNGYSEAVYWKNGLATFVGPDNVTIGSQANAIAISGTDVYIAGFIFDSNKKYPQAIYWKNGVETILSSDPSGSIANAVAVNGSDVYVAGLVHGAAALWKNGALTMLSDPTVNSSAKAIALNGSDVYISGAVAGVTTCWKNGIATSLKGGPVTNISFLGNAIAISGTDVYVAGGFDDLGHAIYWKNGNPVQLTKTNGLINGIAVASH